MYRTGHYGAALLVYAPIGFVLLAAGFDELAAVGAVIVAGGSMVPDWDQKVPFISHRGITHTIWFALLAGALLGAAGWYVGEGMEPRAQLGLAAFGALLGIVTIGAHILADALTPMGIRPFEPLGHGSYSLELTNASNPLGNGLLLVLGLLATGGAVAASREISLAFL
ncbi:metal-dependent hydrolase [Halodesulfurarchaeum sp. HSR-GB]|uniref:metal-dependent hydrolase n=1 Tax=Halodesulfurarchaeum sp. HSR-GB TaxID=3074077 RepID=UPI00285AEE86|nr:metal-dependent hydrolase [Halodesulfurarchaeum sp. HSR-GB]MDR5656281.1 metal-dependent hydrolase [Halodesulfurarchaeum sp. HSR-GB]